MTSNFIFGRTVFAWTGPYAELPSLALDYLQVAVILDLSVTSLRKGLAESDAHRQKSQQETAARERTQEQLLHAQKMDAVGRLTSGIAHDLNNVLEIILGFTVERDRIDDPSARHGEDALALADALDGIELAARRGTNICRKLLDFGRSDKTRPENFDASAALYDLKPLLRQSFSPSILLKIEAPATPLMINFDRSQFELILFNLATNARDAMPKGGQCIISVAQDGPTDLVLVIEDTGVGMPEDVKRHIFEPFFTTKPSGSGTGLGLALVYGLIDRAGGGIEVNSKAGGGTIFRIRLPMVGSDAPGEILESIRVSA
jgi:signal transduction histidine kinase